MTNDLNERKSIAVIVAAIVTTLIFMIGGLTTGLVCAVQKRRDAAPDAGRQMAQYLLVDSARELRSSMSALRLCSDPEPAENINRTALVHAVRAETALECHTDDWADSRNKEAFLNDIATVLHSYDPEQTVQLADTLYAVSDRFYNSVVSGEHFAYDGELVPSDTDDDSGEVTDEDISSGAELVRSALDCDRVEHVGAWNGHIEYYTERNGRSGYAIVCDGKITEYSFTRAESDDYSDVEQAKALALDTAERCGYDGLTVKWSEITGRSVTVIMCKCYDGNMACDDCATAIIFGGEPVAFSAGSCGHEHKDVPARKVTEAEARKANPRESGDGVPVVRTVNGKERVCYEYRFNLEDGVHYVYVCAESGRQIEVK